MAAGVVFTQVLILFVIVGIGFLVGRLKLLSANAPADTSAFIMNVTLPATILQSLFREFDARVIRDGIYCLLLGIALVLLFLGLSVILRKPLRVKEGRRGIWSFASAFSNAGFMGFPVAHAIYGPDGVFFAAMFVVAINLVVYTLGVALLMKDGSGEKNSLKKVLLNGANIATVLGLIVFIGQIKLPGAVTTIVDYLAGTTTPMAMFLTGLYVSGNKLTELVKDKDVLTSAGVKLLVMPLIAFAATRLLPIEAGSVAKNTTLLVMAMPSPAITMILGSHYKCDTTFAGRAVCVSTLLSVGTIPLMMLLVG